MTALLAWMILLSACGGRSLENAALDRPGPQSFVLSVYPESYLAGGSADSIRLREVAATAQDGVRLHNFVVEARGAKELKALVFRLSYDASRFTLVESEPQAVLGRADELLSLELSSDEGVFESAQMLTRPQDKAGQGFSGDGELYHLSFASQPQRAALRRSSAVPLSDDARCNLIFNPFGPLLSWRIFNPGDYSQDGQVLASDLTPIGIHFNEDVPAGTDPDGRDENSVQDVVDGNNDGKVAVADLTAIGLNFQNKILSFKIYRSNDPLDVPTSNDGPNGPGTITVANVLFGDASGNPGQERRFFDFGLANDPSGAIYWVRPNDEVSDGTPSNSALGGNAANQAPIAVLDADVVEGTVPLTVNFDASATVDEDIPGLTFTWDFEGDGNFDTLSSSEATISHEYTDAGQFNATVRVVDSGALLDTESIQVLVNAAGNLPPTANLQLITTDEGLTTAVVLDATGSGDLDGTIKEFRFDLDSDGQIDKVFEEGETPIISFNLSATGEFNFTLQVVDDQQGTGTATETFFNNASFIISDVTDLDNFVEPVDIAVGGFSRSPSEASRFMVGYMDNGRRLKSLFSEDFNGLNWKDEVQVTNNFGSELPNCAIHLGAISGLPVLVFIDEVTGNSLRYVRANDQDGQSWPSPQFVANGQRLRSPFLRLVDGKPAIGYYSEAVNANANITAFFVSAKNSIGSGSWESPVTIDGGFLRDKNLVPFPRLQMLFVSGDQEPAVLINGLGLMREHADNKRGTDWDGDADFCLVDTVFASSYQLESGDEAVGAFINEGSADNFFVSSHHVTNAFGAFAGQWIGQGSIVDSSPDISPLIEFRRDNGLGVICWHDNDINALMFAKSTNGEAEDYGEPQVVDFVDTACFDMTVLSSTGRLLIVYFDKTQQKIMAASL